MNEEQFYKDSITEMLLVIHNVEWLRKIYSFIKVFFDDVDGRRNGKRQSGEKAARKGGVEV